MSEQDELPVGEFEVVSAPASIKRSIVRAAPLILLLMLLVMSAVVHRHERAIWPMLGLPLVIVLALAGWWRAFNQTRHGIRYHVRLTEEYIGVRQPSADLRIPWRAITSADTRKGILIVRSDTAVIALPWYNMSELQRRAIDVYLAANPRAAASRATGSRQTLILWIALILLFTTVYRLFR